MRVDWGRAVVRAHGVAGGGVAGWPPGAARDRSPVGGPLAWLQVHGYLDDELAGLGVWKLAACPYVVGSTPDLLFARA